METKQENSAMIRAMRNLDCPHYSDCLNQAAKANASGWDCSSCPEKNTKTEMRDYDILGCKILLHAIFNPNLYALYRGSKGPRKGQHVSVPQFASV